MKIFGACIVVGMALLSSCSIYRSRSFEMVEVSASSFGWRTNVQLFAYGHSSGANPDNDTLFEILITAEAKDVDSTRFGVRVDWAELSVKGKKEVITNTDTTMTFPRVNKKRAEEYAVDYTLSKLVPRQNKSMIAISNDIDSVSTLIHLTFCDTEGVNCSASKTSFHLVRRESAFPFLTLK